MTFREAYAFGENELHMAGIDDAGVDAWYLLEYVTGINRTMYFMKMMDKMNPEEEKRYLEYIEIRKKHIPLQHITGVQEFMGFEFVVNEHVLVPRQDTEVLVETVLKDMKPGADLLDMCVGSGCILLSLVKLGENVQGTGVDISEEALKVALKNREKLEVNVNLIHSDLFQNVEGKYDVIHFQWLPFLEYISIEKWFLIVYRAISSRSRFVLTQHNLYPHNSSEHAKQLYCKRMLGIKAKFDHFILHTESSKKAFCEEFKVDESLVSVVYHGVFLPDSMPIRNTNCSQERVLMFGIQSYYKGTDILVDAVALLPEDIRNKFDVTIAGSTEGQLLAGKCQSAEKNGITWISRYIEDDELNQLIVDSDILVLPYRAISQSGVLLQALPYKKHIIASDLPSFRETLKGYPEECFFKVGSAESLAKSLTDYINGKVDKKIEMMANQELLECYSWSTSAKNTRDLYRKLLN